MNVYISIFKEQYNQHSSYKMINKPSNPPDTEASSSTASSTETSSKPTANINTLSKPVDSHHTEALPKKEKTPTSPVKPLQQIIVPIDKNIDYSSTLTNIVSVHQYVPEEDRKDAKLIMAIYHKDFIAEMKDSIPKGYQIADAFKDSITSINDRIDKMNEVIVEIKSVISDFLGTIYKVIQKAMKLKSMLESPEKVEKILEEIINEVNPIEDRIIKIRTKADSEYINTSSTMTKIEQMLATKDDVENIASQAKEEEAKQKEYFDADKVALQLHKELSTANETFAKLTIEHVQLDKSVERQKLKQKELEEKIQKKLTSYQEAMEKIGYDDIRVEKEYQQNVDKSEQLKTEKLMKIHEAKNEIITMKQKQRMSNIDVIHGIFIIDRSGSMAGKRNVNAKIAFDMFMQMFKEESMESYVSLIFFGSDAEVIFSKKSILRDSGTSYPSGEPDGGSKIYLNAIKKALEVCELTSKTLTTVPNIFFITDDEPGDSASGRTSIEQQLATFAKNYSARGGKFFGIDVSDQLQNSYLEKMVSVANSGVTNYKSAGFSCEYMICTKDDALTEQVTKIIRFNKYKYYQLIEDEKTLDSDIKNVEAFYASQLKSLEERFYAAKKVHASLAERQRILAEEIEKEKIKIQQEHNAVTDELSKKEKELSVAKPKVESQQKCTQILQMKVQDTDKNVAEIKNQLSVIMTRKLEIINKRASIINTTTKGCSQEQVDTLSTALRKFVRDSSNVNENLKRGANYIIKIKSLLESFIAEINEGVQKIPKFYDSSPDIRFLKYCGGESGDYNKLTTQKAFMNIMKERKGEEVKAALKAISKQYSLRELAKLLADPARQNRDGTLDEIKEKLEESEADENVIEVYQEIRELADDLNEKTESEMGKAEGHFMAAKEIFEKGVLTLAEIFQTAYRAIDEK